MSRIGSAFITASHSSSEPMPLAKASLNQPAGPCGCGLGNRANASWPTITIEFRSMTGWKNGTMLRSRSTVRTRCPTFSAWSCSPVAGPGIFGADDDGDVRSIWYSCRVSSRFAVRSTTSTMSSGLVRKSRAPSSNASLRVSDEVSAVSTMTGR